MTEQPRARVQWRSPSALKLHATLLAGLALCAAASWIEWGRALEGRTIAWVYAFEWPLFAVLGTYAWWRLLHEEQRGPRRPPRPPRTHIADDDPGLVAWRTYLDDLHASERRQPPVG